MFREMCTAGEHGSVKEPALHQVEPPETLSRNGRGSTHGLAAGSVDSAPPFPSNKPDSAERMLAWLDDAEEASFAESSCMTSTPALERLFNVVIRFETELWNAVDARLRVDCDLPLGQFEPMQVISRHGSCRVHDISDELGITMGGVSKIVDRIQASGHCLRRPNPADRRSSVIELTTAGVQLLSRATEAFEQELRAQLGTALIAAVEYSPPAQAPRRNDPTSELRRIHHPPFTGDRYDN
jgi:DNA-binding MarR family transcriptional regulator